MKKFSYKKQILEHHLDTLGHVNNATYLELYEEARWDFITAGGYGMKEFQSFKKGPVILEVNVRYKRELPNREWIEIVSETVESKGKVMKLSQQILNSKGEVCSEALFTFGFMDLVERKLINPIPEWLKAVGVID